MSCILLVHNESSVLDQFAAAMRAAGLVVRATSDPMNALDILDAEAPVALVSGIDFGPRILNGLALGRMARLRHPDVAILFVCHRDWGHLTDDLGPAFRMPVQPAVLVDALLAQLRRTGDAPGVACDTAAGCLM